MIRDGVDIVAAPDPRNHCDAISKPTVLLQFVAVDRRQLRLVSKVEDADLRIKVEDSRDFGVFEIEVDEKRARPRSQHRAQPNSDTSPPVRAPCEATTRFHPPPPP